MTAASPFAQAYPQLTGLGYSCIPLIGPNAAHSGRGKAPGRFVSGAWQGCPDWQQFRTTPLSGFMLQLALKAPDANIGIVCGTPAGEAPDGTPLFVISVDIDTTDPEAFNDIERAIPPSPMRVKGQKGWKAFYRAPASIRSRGYDDARVPKGSGTPRRLVDVLTGFDTRQAVVAPSRHPDGAIYQWLNGEPVAACDLPIFSEADHERLVETLQLHGYDPDAGRRSRVDRAPYVPSNPVDGDVFDEVKAAALANIGAWIHDVPGLYGLRPARGGYECVNTLRESSSGQPLERRKRNLSIQANGIKDFGTGDTWSAIDFVADFCGLSVSEALTWLEGRLGLAPPDVAIELGRPVAKSQTAPAPVSAGTEAAQAVPRQAVGTVAAAFIDATHGAADEVETELPARLCEVPGLVGDIARWITATARKPQPAHALAMSIALIGTLAGRKYSGPTQSGTHLFILATGPTGSGKNAPKKAAAQLLAAAGYERIIGPSSFSSATALIEHVADCPASLCVMDEFAMLIGKINSKNGSSHEKAISGEMRQFWTLSFEEYKPPKWASGRTRVQLPPIISPALSIIGITTADELYTVLQGADVLSGFLNRFTLVPTLSNPLDVEPTADVFNPPDELVKGLQAIADVGGPLAQATMHGFRPEKPLVQVLWDGGPSGLAYRTFRALVATVAEMTEHEALTQRTAEMAVRLATIRAIGIAGPHARVTVDDMQWGADFALWSTRRLIADVNAHMVESEHQSRVKFVLRLLKEAGGYLSRTDLCRKVNHRFDARTLDSVIDGLLQAGQIRLKELEPGKTGRKPAGYFIVAGA